MNKIFPQHGQDLGKKRNPERYSTCLHESGTGLILIVAQNRQTSD